MDAGPVDSNHALPPQDENSDSLQRRAIHHQNQIAAPPSLRFGSLKGKIWIADDFDAPLPDRMLAEFEKELEP